MNAGRDHRARGRLRAKHRAAQIHGRYTVEIGRLQIDERRALLDAGVAK